MSDKKILEVKNLKVFYESSGSFFTNKNIVKAVNGIDININQNNNSCNNTNRIDNNN